MYAVYQPFGVCHHYPYNHYSCIISYENEGAIFWTLLNALQKLRLNCGFTCFHISSNILYGLFSAAVAADASNRKTEATLYKSAGITNNAKKWLSGKEGFTV